MKWILTTFLKGFCFFAIAFKGYVIANDVPTQYISLGSCCEVAYQIQVNQLRHKSYPFDWLLSIDNKGVVEILEDDFLFFLNLDDLVQIHAQNKVVNTKYAIEFKHDFEAWHFDRSYPQVKAKYDRRITRFNDLASYPGKVFFIRAPIEERFGVSFGINTEKCKMIDRKQAIELLNALLKKFPHLDFCLVIINYKNQHDEPIVGIDRILEFQIDAKNKNHDWNEVFRLIKEMR